MTRVFLACLVKTATPEKMDRSDLLDNLDHLLSRSLEPRENLDCPVFQERLERSASRVSTDHLDLTEPLVYRVSREPMDTPVRLACRARKATVECPDSLALTDHLAFLVVLDSQERLVPLARHTVTASCW